MPNPAQTSSAPSTAPSRTPTRSFKPRFSTLNNPTASHATLASWPRQLEQLSGPLSFSAELGLVFRPRSFWNALCFVPLADVSRRGGGGGLIVWDCVREACLGAGRGTNRASHTSGVESVVSVDAALERRAGDVARSKTLSALSQSLNSSELALRRQALTLLFLPPAA